VTPFHPAKLATLIIGLALPLGAMAQGTAVAPPAVAAKAKHHHHAPATPEQMAARMERHLSDLRTTLRITPAQQSHWDRFAQVTRDNAAELHQRFQLRGTALASMDAADNMADYAQISELHAQELVKLSDAFRALYASMDEAQKQGADVAFRSGRPPGAMPRG
jgi:hypothetical protein